MSAKLYQINPNRELPWNDLPILPINKEIYHNLDIIEKLGNTKAALARLQGRSAVIPNQGLLINTISLQEAKTSNAIENIFTTDDDLYRAFSDQKEEEQGAAKEVLRYREALWSGYNYLQSKSIFDEEYFLQVFREIKQTKDKFRPEFLNTFIKHGGSGINAGKIIYTPPRGKDVIKQKLQNLIDFLNTDKYEIDPILKMCIAHFQFEAIHPFRDGNGRTGRIMNIHYLTKVGLLDVPILFLSKYILDNKDDYYSGLMGVSQRGDWKTWLLFMLDAIEVTSNITYNKINEIISAKDSILDHLHNNLKKIRTPSRLVELIFTQPFTKVKHLIDAGIYSENTAREYLNRLCDEQILEKKIIGGHHYYLNIELYRILSD